MKSVLLSHFFSFLSYLTWNLNILFLVFFLQEPLYKKRGYVRKLCVISENKCGFDWKKSVLDSLQSCLETRKVLAGSYSCWRRPHRLCFSCPGNSFSFGELCSDSFSTSPFCCSMYLYVTSKDRKSTAVVRIHYLEEETAATNQYLFLAAGCFSSSMVRHSLWNCTVSQDATRPVCLKLWLSLSARCGSDLGGLPPAAHEHLFSSLLTDSCKLLSDLSVILHPALLGRLALTLLPCMEITPTNETSDWSEKKNKPCLMIGQMLQCSKLL